MSFGAAFGKLIKHKRGIEGLTQQSLAVLAFGDEGRKSRISELENGKIPRPHPKTVDAIAVALNISDIELGNLDGFNAHARYVDNLTDYAELDGHQTLDIEIAVTADGRAVLFHNRDFNVDFDRVEFFQSDWTIVFLTSKGSRRSAGLKLRGDVCRYLKDCSELIFVRSFDGGEKIEGARCPILLIP